MNLPALLTLRDDCLLDAASELAQARERVNELQRENAKLRGLTLAQRAEIALLTERRTDFELSADAELPCIIRLQAG